MVSDRVAFRKSGGVSLCLLEKGDVEDLLRWVNDPEVTRYLGSFFGRPIGRVQEEEWVQRPRAGGSTDLGIVVDGVLIGVIGMRVHDPRDRTATLGIFIGEKSCWGKGYGRKAATLMLRYAFLTENLRKISASIYEPNTASLALCERKLGFRRCGLRREHHWIEDENGGRYCDDVELELFRDEWLANWSGSAKSIGE